MTTRAVDLSQFLVPLGSSILHVMQCIHQNGACIALVVDADQRLQATVTDGDIRTAILGGVDVRQSVDGIISQQARAQGRETPKPITAPADTPAVELLRVMRAHGIRQVPLLDAEGRVVDVALHEALLEEEPLALAAVVMAGGRGTRLRPLTDDVPKPMLHVGDRPVMERIMGRLKEGGIRRVCVSTHYRADAIKEHFGDGARVGLELSYITEESPLGTAGALRQLGPQDAPLLVINGDVLTDVDVRAMHSFHADHSAVMTVGVRQIEVPVPYGVVQTEGVEIRSLTEKPVIKLYVNAGIYLLQPEALQHIPPEGRLDMTDLITRLMTRGLKVISFPIHEYWIDIGQPADYERAQDDLRKGRIK